MLHEVLLPGGLPHDALAAAVLRPVCVERDALAIAKVRERHGHVLFLNDVVEVDIVRGERDLRAARVGVLAAHLEDLLLDDAEQQPLVRKDRLIMGNGLHKLRVLIHDFVALEAREASKAHIEDGLRLLLRKAEAFAQALLCNGSGGRFLDDLHNLVDVVKRDDEAFQNVQALLCAVKVVLRPAGDDLLLEGEVMGEHLPEVEHLRLAVHKGKHDDAEGILQLGVLVELVQDDVRVHVLLELDDDAHAVAVGFIPEVGNALHALVMHKLRDLFHKARFVHLVRDLRDDDAALAAVHLLDLRLCAHHDAAAAGAVGLADARRAHDGCSRGEVRAGDVGHEFLHGDVPVFDHGDVCVDHLAQVVGRDVRRHADGDAARAVYEQVREAAGEHLGLHERLIEVRPEVHGVLVDVCEHLFGNAGEARLGVTHGGGAVAVHGAVIALAFHEHVAGIEILCKAHHRVIDGGVAVGMVFAQHVAHDARALVERLVGGEALFIHGIEDAPVHGLEAVPHIGQRTVDDDRHGVGDKRFLHLLLNVEGIDPVVHF